MPVRTSRMQILPDYHKALRSGRALLLLFKKTRKARQPKGLPFADLHPYLSPVWKFEEDYINLFSDKWYLVIPTAQPINSQDTAADRIMRMAEWFDKPRDRGQRVASEMRQRGL